MEDTGQEVRTSEELAHPSRSASIEAQLVSLRAALMTPQAYAAVRDGLRPQMIAHRRARAVALGPSMRLLFEDATTVRHQVQEVVRAENIVDADELRGEVQRYAHLLPDATHWVATLMIEIADAQQRRLALDGLNDAVHRIYLELPKQPRLRASVNDDLADRHRARPSAVHFLRFALPDDFRAALFSRPSLTLGCDHAAYAWRQPLSAPLLARLTNGLSATPA